MMASTPANDSPTIENTTRSAKVRRMFGLDLHGWEHATLWFLGVVAIGGIGVVVATYAVIKLQRAESAQAKKELAQYQTKAAAEIAAANAVAETAKQGAANAELKAEQIRERMAPRQFDEDAFLAYLAGKEKWPVVELWYADENDSLWVAVRTLSALDKAGWAVSAPKPLRGPNPTMPLASSVPLTVTYGAQPSGVSVIAKTIPELDAAHAAAFLRSAFGAAIKGTQANLGRDETMAEGTLRIVIAPKN